MTREEFAKLLEYADDSARWHWRRDLLAEFDRLTAEVVRLQEELAQADTDFKEMLDPEGW